MKHFLLFSFFLLATSVFGDAAPSKTTEAVKKKDLEKTPKSLFLIKKIKVSPDVGEPQFDPAEAQLRTVINDAALQNTKKFE